MAINYEYERHIRAAKEAGNEMAVEALENQRDGFNILAKAGILTELPREIPTTELMAEKVSQTPAKIDAPATIILDSPEKQDRQLREALNPFIQEYKSTKLHTPDLINNTWNGIWRVIGERVEFDYQVQTSDRTTEELAQLKIENRANLLLPDDIYTPSGLIRLGGAFPLMSSWTTTPEEAIRISHSITTGGSIDIEMNHDAPYRTRQGYTELQLKEKIAADGRRGMRLPTDIVGSQFSQLLSGYYFDENTWARTPESFYGGQALRARFFSDGSLNVDDWYPSSQDPYLGGRSEGDKRA